MVSGPNFQRLRTALLCQGEPDRVPLVEAGIDNGVKERFLGRKIVSFADEIAFWAQAGYDFIPVEAGLRLIIDAAIHHEGAGRFDGETPAPVRAAQDFARTKLRAADLVTHGADGAPDRHWAPEKVGIIETLDDVAAFPWPAPQEMDYSLFERASKELPDGMRVIAYTAALFSSAFLMMGMENFFISLASDDRLVGHVFDCIAEFQLAVLDRVLSYPILGAVWINDDMGHHSSLLVSPRHLRRFVFPYYREVARRVHARGLPLMLHSDGCIYKVLDELADLGFDAFHPIEPEAMDIRRVRQMVGPNKCLIGNVSLSRTLTVGTPADVENDVRWLMEEIAPGGGYCVGSANSIPDYVPYENYLALREASLRYGAYPIRPRAGGQA